MMRHWIVLAAAVALPAPALAAQGGAVEMISFHASGGVGALSEAAEFDPATSAIFGIGLGFDRISPHDGYVGVALEGYMTYAFSAAVLEIDVGVGSVSAGRASVRTPFLGIVAGYGGGTYTREEDVFDYGGVFEVDNDIEGVPLLAVLGYRVFGRVILGVDLGLGAFIVTGQDPEVPEAQVDGALPLAQVRLRLGLPMAI